MESNRNPPCSDVHQNQTLILTKPVHVFSSVLVKNAPKGTTLRILPREKQKEMIGATAGRTLDLSQY